MCQKSTEKLYLSETMDAKIHSKNIWHGQTTVNILQYKKRNRWTEKMFTLNAMYVILYKRIFQLHKM